MLDELVGLEDMGARMVYQPLTDTDGPPAHHPRTPLPGVRLSPAQGRRIVRRRLAVLANSLHLSAVGIARLSRRLAARHYAPGELILMEGVRGDCFGLVVAGQVAVHTSPAYADQPTLLLLPGATFGEAMVAEGRSSGSTLRARTAAEIHFLRRADLLAEVERSHPHPTSPAIRWTRRLAAVALVLLVANLVLALTPTRQALALVPYGAGLWLEDEGRHDKTVESLWIVAQYLVPDWAGPHLALGNLYWERGQLDAARAELERGLALAPDLPEAHNSLGLLYVAQCDYAAARQAFESALALEPGQAAVEGNLAFSLQETGHPADALPHYTLALSLDTPRPLLLANWAIALYQTGDLEAAADAAAQALALDPTLAPAQTVSGAVALAREHASAAIPPLQEAVRLDPAYGPAHFYLGLAYKSSRQPAAAIPAFERALVLTTDPIALREARRHLAELYARYGTGIVSDRPVRFGERR